MRRWWVLGCAVLGGCSGGQDSAIGRPQMEAAAAEVPPSGGVVDSALPIAEHLRRFRSGLDSTDRLRGGAPTPAVLARRFLRALAARDSAGLARMVLSRAEYGWVYYPSHIYHDPPYELDPNTFWMLIQANSGKGFVRLLRRYAGRELAFRHLRCTPSRNVRPPLREVERCTLDFDVDGTSESRRMFGSIVGDATGYKFVSYANEF